MRARSFTFLIVALLPLTGSVLVDAAAGEPVAIPVEEPSLREIAVAAGAVWVVGFETVVRIDQATGTVTDTIEVPSAHGVAATEVAVWVGSAAGVVRIDPRSRQIVAEVPTGGVSTEGVAADEVSAWVVSDHNAMLSVIDAAPNTVVREIPIVGRFPEVAVGTTAVWVTPGEYGSGQPQRVDRISGEVGAVDVGGQELNSVASHENVAWVVSDEHSVCRVDDRTGDVACVRLAIHEFDQEIASISYGDGVLWAAIQGDPSSGEGCSAIALDPDSLAVLSEVELPVGVHAIFDIAAGTGAAYLSSDLGASSSVIVVSA